MVDCDVLIPVKHLINGTKARVLRDTAASLPHRTGESTLCCSRKIGRLSPVSTSATGPTSPTVMVPSYRTWTFQAACRKPATVRHWKVTALELDAVKRWIGTLAGLRSVPTAAQKRYSGA